MKQLLFSSLMESDKATRNTSSETPQKSLQAAE
jgi:hypothetical protein